jgi:hypothetical protein
MVARARGQFGFDVCAKAQGKKVGLEKKEMVKLIHFTLLIFLNFSLCACAELVDSRFICPPEGL